MLDYEKKYFSLINNLLRDVTGKFPDYPDEDEGGSALIFKNKTVKELENDLEELVIKNLSIITYISIKS
jgi:hypothetical protein